VADDRDAATADGTGSTATVDTGEQQQTDGQQPRDAEQPADQTDQQPSDATDDELAALGEAGKRAIEREREARRLAEQRAREAAEQAQRARDEATSEQERAVAEAREEARREALAEATTRLARAEAEAVAAGRLANPALAPRLIDADQHVTRDGDVDREALRQAIDELVASEPYLAAGQGATPSSGDAARGRRQEPQPASMSDQIRRAAGY